MGIKIQSISKSVETTVAKPSFLQQEIKWFETKLSAKAKEDFYGELSLLLQSGIHLKMALDILVESQKKAKHQRLYGKISNQLMAGSSLSQSMSETDQFSAYEIQAIAIGEQTGKLPKIVEDLRSYFQRKNELRRQLISSLSYPVIVLVLAVAVVFFMLRYVVPIFVDIFKQNKVELPWITQQIVLLSDWATGNSLLLFLLMTLLPLIWKWISQKTWYYRLSGGLQLKIPVLGNYLRKIYLIQFTQAMALLCNAKITLVDAIDLARNMIRFYPLENTLKPISQDIVRGSKLHHSFEKYPIFDKKMIALLRVAEETNQTEFIFQKLFDQYSAEIKHKGQLITNVFNFVLTLFVGLIVGIILVALYLPMFKLSSVIG